MDRPHYATLADAIVGTTAPQEIIDTLALIEVPFWNPMVEQLESGRLVVASHLADELLVIFKTLAETRFPITSIIPMTYFGDDDDASMAANNTSSFCYRQVVGTNRRSPHSLGLAVDLNPQFNSYMTVDGRILPLNVIDDPSDVRTLHSGHSVVQLFESYGWRWLGRRTERPDNHHFDKLPTNAA